MITKQFIYCLVASLIVAFASCEHQDAARIETRATYNATSRDAEISVALVSYHNQNNLIRYDANYSRYKRDGDKERSSNQ